MDLNKLRELGGIIPQTPVIKQVTWTPPAIDGVAQEEVTFTVRVKKLSFGLVERLLADRENRSNMASIISGSIILGDEGTESLTYDDAFQLETGLANSLITAISDVNGTGVAKN